jgi:multidomain signaling protein FimX
VPGAQRVDTICMKFQLRPESAINILILEKSLNDADRYASNLRNAGMPVHPTRLDNPDALLELLTDREKEADLVFYADGSAGVDLSQAVAICHKQRPDIPFIVIAKEESDPKLRVTAMRLGAADTVQKDDKEHLHLAVAREYTYLIGRRELTELKAKLRESEDRCNLLVENSRDAIAYVHEGMYINANQAYLEMFGYVDMGDLEGMPILDMVAPQDHKVFKEFLRSLDQEGSKKEMDIHCRSSDGNIFDAHLEFSPASIEGEPCTQIIIHEQQSSKELEQRIKLLASQDAHTGLANRNYFMEKLDDILQRPEKERKPHSLLYLLIDNLHEIRAAAGITATDALLKELAEILQHNVSKSELLARFGEHTFTILSEHAGSNEALALAEKIRAAVEDHLYRSLDQMAQPTCSVGISYLSPKTQDGQALINQAYNACESAHTEGGNRIATYDASKVLTQASEGKGSELQIKELIQYALEHDRFRMVYQPLVSLQGDSRENYAAGLRLLDNNNKEIFPEHFISYAEQAGLMASVDRWVIEHATKELVKQRSDKHKVNFFVNISGAGVADEGLLLWICDCLRDNNAKGSWITFQVAEGDLRAHTQSARKLMEGLKKIGCQLAITKFGKLPKYETLLKHLPVDYVKLDVSFIKGLATDQKKQDELNGVNKVVQSFNKKVIALGVEDANTLAILWTIGVNYIQGYYLQEPSEQINFDFSSF